MKYYTGLFFLLFISFTVKAQPSGVPANTLVPELFTSTNLFEKENETIYKIDGENVKGSPFLDSGWLSGSIVLNDNRIFNIQKVRYNIYAQVITFLENNQPLDVTESIKEFTLTFNNNFKRRFVNASNYKKQKVTQYFEVLLESKKGILLKKYEKKVQADTDIASRNRMKHFETFCTYYYFDINKEKLASIKKNGNNITEILSLTEVQKNQLVAPRFDNSDEDSILSFFNLYNTLP